MQIDYLTLTIKEDFGHKGAVVSSEQAAWVGIMAARSLGFSVGVDARTSPARWPYRWAVKVEDFSFTIHVPHDPLVHAVMFVASGSSCSSDGIGPSFVSSAVRRGWRCTRIDFALDMIDEGITAEDVDEHLAKHPPTTVRTMGFIRSQSGDTVYIGSRRSERFIRVYDKGKKEGYGHEVTRFEMELKGDMAAWAADNIQGGSAPFKSEMARVLSADCAPEGSPLRILLGGDDAARFHRVRTIPARERWFKGQVAAAFKAWYEEEPAAAAAWVQYLLAEVVGQGWGVE